MLVLSFWPENDGARIELAQINVADSDFAGVSHGWEKYYWTPWRAYLLGPASSSPGTDHGKENHNGSPRPV